MRILNTEKMPASNGHYSQVIEHNGILYLSGQLPLNPETKKIPDTIEEQTLQALLNVDLILNEAGSSREKIIQMRIYIPDIALWDRVNAVYSKFFGNHKPSRSIVPTGELHFGCLIEVEATAAV